MLDDRVLLAARRYPRLIAGLHIRMGEQYQRLAAHLVICQLPRVEDRVLSMMWLLAESWGRVTISGTILPITLTHDAVGEMIGARRPTVTLALRELADRGALFRQDGGWLLLEPAPGLFGMTPLSAPTVELNGATGMSWRDHGRRSPPNGDHNGLGETVGTMLTSHVRSAREVQERIDASRRARERSRQLRDRIATRRRPSAPSG
jgi:hypothetical protein